MRPPRFAVMIFALLLALSCGGRRDRFGTNVLLVTVDTLRADHVGCYGNDQVKTPAIDALAARGVRFASAWSPIPITLPAHASILTGLYPHQHGVRDNGTYRVPDVAVSFAEIARDAGYETAAFVSSYVLSGEYNIDQGFDLFDDEMGSGPPSAPPALPEGKVPAEVRERWAKRWKRDPPERNAASVVSSAIEWLGGRGGVEKPFFCWVHIYDPHSSYTPPEPWAEMYSPGYDGPIDGDRHRYLALARQADEEERKAHTERMIALYAGEVSYADLWIGRLLESIPENTLVLFASDHGEAFTEHGRIFEHMQTIYVETTHVPLIAAGPGVGPPGAVRSDPVSLVDMVPTLLDYLGLDRARELPGGSLLDSDNQEKERPAAVYCETLCGKRVKNWSGGVKGVRTGDWSLIFRLTGEGNAAASLYNLDNDPGEKINRIDGEPEKQAELVAELEKLLALEAIVTDSSSYWPMGDDEERLEKLRALGYVE